MSCSIIKILNKSSSCKDFLSVRWFPLILYQLLLRSSLKTDHYLLNINTSFVQTVKSVQFTLDTFSHTPGLSIYISQSMKHLRKDTHIIGTPPNKYIITLIYGLFSQLQMVNRQVQRKLNSMRYLTQVASYMLHMFVSIQYFYFSMRIL